MTTTLLLRFTGPMQSWGTQSRFRYRETDLEPSRSGVIGLLCSALGRPRTAPLDDFMPLRMGVRVDRGGIVSVDFQTAGGSHRQGDHYGVARAENAGIDIAISWRSYLANASFLVGLEARESASEAFLSTLDEALDEPVWPLFLGRKSYLPSMPVRLPDEPPLGPGLQPVSLDEALHSYPWDDVPSGILRVRAIVECTPDDPKAEARGDLPLSFALDHRGFTTRYVKTLYLPPPSTPDNS